jgi:hypothetical protein
MYSRSIAIREANNKRKANKGKEGEDEEGDEGEGGEDAGEPLTIAMCFGSGEDENDADDLPDDADEDGVVQTPY